MTTVATRTCTIDEYRELDAEAEDERYEFQNGSVIPVAGAEPEHNQIKDNISRKLGNGLLERGCFVTTSDQRVRASFDYLYADVVVASEPTYEDTPRRALSKIRS